MITALVERETGAASICLFNNYGEVDTANWRETDFQWAADVADRFGWLLVDVREGVPATSVEHGFVRHGDSVYREPRLRPVSHVR